MQGFDEFIGFVGFPVATGPIDCGLPTTSFNGHSEPVNQIDNWTGVQLELQPGDSDPFFVRYAPFNDGSGAALTASELNLWKVSVDAQGNFAGTHSGGPFTAPDGTPLHIRNLNVSPYTYTFQGKPARVYGAVLGAEVTGAYGYAATAVEVGGNVYWNRSLSPIPIDGRPKTASIAFAPPDGNEIQQGEGTFFVREFIVSSVTPDPVPARVFVTSDFGATWRSILGGGLPSLPVDVVRFDPADPTGKAVYAGTEIGLYRTADIIPSDGTVWDRFGNSLPMVRVTDLAISRNASLLRLATYGRGLWEAYPRNLDHSGVGPGDGDWDGDGKIDWLDLAALAGRLGTQPGYPGVAPYDWSVDFLHPDDTGGGGACDGAPGPCISDASLSALLAKFGGAR